MSSAGRSAFERYACRASTPGSIVGQFEFRLPTLSGHCRNTLMRIGRRKWPVGALSMMQSPVFSRGRRNGILVPCAPARCHPSLLRQTTRPARANFATEDEARRFARPVRQSSASGWATKIRTRRIEARMRNAGCWPFQTCDCHIANHSPPTARKAMNQTRNPQPAPAKTNRLAW